MTSKKNLFSSCTQTKKAFGSVVSTLIMFIAINFLFNVHTKYELKETLYQENFLQILSICSIRGMVK